MSQLRLFFVLAWKNSKTLLAISLLSDRKPSHMAYAKSSPPRDGTPLSWQTGSRTCFCRQNCSKLTHCKRAGALMTARCTRCRGIDAWLRYVSSLWRFANTRTKLWPDTRGSDASFKRLPCHPSTPTPCCLKANLPKSTISPVRHPDTAPSHHSNRRFLENGYESTTTVLQCLNLRSWLATTGTWLKRATPKWQSSMPTISTQRLTGQDFRRYGSFSRNFLLTSFCFFPLALCTFFSFISKRFAL